MTPSIENNHVQVSEHQWDSVLNLIVDETRSDDEIYQALRTVFEQQAIPINGYFEVSADIGSSFVNAAISHWSEPLLRIIAENAPHKATEGVDILAESVWSDKAVEILLSRGYAADGIRGQQAQDILQRCANFGTPGAIALLAERGLNLDGLVKFDDVVLPALVHAARRGRSEVIEGFLRAGANPVIAGYDGCTFLHAAVILDGAKGKAWTDSEDNVDRLRAALALSQELGIDVNPRDSAGRTPLHLAAERGYPGKAAALLEFGAGADMCDDDGQTPLMLAQAGNHDEVCSVILSWKAHEAVMAVAKSSRAPDAAVAQR